MSYIFVFLVCFFFFFSDTPKPEYAIDFCPSKMSNLIFSLLSALTLQGIFLASSSFGPVSCHRVLNMPGF